MINKTFKNKYFNLTTILVFAISFTTFLIITTIFNKVIPVFAISGVRPSATLNPVLGLAFGWPAIIGCTLANFISDLVSNYGIDVALLGLFPQIVYGALPYYVWKVIVKSVSMRTRLDSPFKVIAYVLLMAINSIIIGVEVGLIQLYSIKSQFLETSLFAALNDFGVCLAFGLPLMVLLDFIYSRFIHKGKRKLSDNEMVVLLSSLCQFVIFGLNILIVYITNNGEDNEKLWSTIYTITLMTTGLILLISILVMILMRKKAIKGAGLNIINKKNGSIYVDTKRKIEFTSLPGDYPENRFKADFLGYKGRSSASITSYERGWYCSLSSQKGCLMNCAFCDCPGVGYHGNVSKDEFAYQINTILDTHYVSHTIHFQVDFTRMGEPSLNNEILKFIEFDLRSLINNKIDVEHVVPYISTMLPKNQVLVKKFLLEYCRIKNDVYNGEADLQLSIHSTDDKVRSALMHDRTLKLEEISQICKELPLPKGNKYALSFAIGKNSIVDIAVLDTLFDKNKFLVKLSPIHSSYNAIDNGFDTMNCYSKNSLLASLEENLISAGWDVIIHEDTVEEDNDDLTCGKLILANVINNVKHDKQTRVKYGIIAALKYEEELFRSQLNDVKKITLLNKPAYTGILGDNEVVIMQCGMGKVSAGICAQAMIDLYRPDFIINTGCAGALDPDLKVGDIVVSESVVEWDLDLRQIGLPLGYIDALSCVEMKASSFLANKIMNSKTDGINAKFGVVASGDQFVSTNEQRKIITENFPGALCAEMEGGAIGHVCLQNDVPFCIIRSISDTADGNSGVDFEKFSEESSKISAFWLINMLKGDGKND